MYIALKQQLHTQDAILFAFFFKVQIQFSHPIILSKEALFFKGIISIFSCNRKVTAKIPIIVMQSNPVMFGVADNPPPKKLACFENVSLTSLGFPGCETDAQFRPGNCKQPDSLRKMFTLMLGVQETLWIGAEIYMRRNLNTYKVNAIRRQSSRLDTRKF